MEMLGQYDGKSCKDEHNTYVAPLSSKSRADESLRQTVEAACESTWSWRLAHGAAEACCHAMHASRLRFRTGHF